MTNTSKSAYLYDVNWLKFPNVRRKNALNASATKA